MLPSSQAGKHALHWIWDWGTHRAVSSPTARTFADRSVSPGNQATRVRPVYCITKARNEFVENHSQIRWCRAVYFGHCESTPNGVKRTTWSVFFGNKSWSYKKSSYHWWSTVAGIRIVNALPVSLVGPETTGTWAMQPTAGADVGDDRRVETIRTLTRSGIVLFPRACLPNIQCACLNVATTEWGLVFIELEYTRPDLGPFAPSQFRGHIEEVMIGLLFGFVLRRGSYW